MQGDSCAENGAEVNQLQDFERMVSTNLNDETNKSNKILRFQKIAVPAAPAGR